MTIYQEQTNVLLDQICKGIENEQNFILIGDNSSGKSEILYKLVEKKCKQGVYFIDSVNRTFDIFKVELESRTYEYVNFDPSCVVSERLLPINFNLQDTFKALGCIEQLYERYRLEIENMCKVFLNKNIRIEREYLEAGLIENRVIINNQEAQLSSGYQAIIRIFCEILYFSEVLQVRGWKSGTIVIDELDEFLSPKFCSNIFNYLTQKFPNIRFVVTTHSLDLVENAEGANLIVIRENSYDLYNSIELNGAVLTADIFSDLFFEDKKIHKSEDDEIDKQLRRLLNLRISGAWCENAQQELQKLKKAKMLPHQCLIYKQIEEW